MPTPNMETAVTTGKVRLSYAHLFEPFAQTPGQEPKFSCTILIPKSDEKTVTAIKKAQLAAKKAKFGDRPPTNLRNTLHDGDEEADLERNPEYAGHYFMAINSKTRPGVVDKDVNPIIDSTQVYSGCYALVQMNAYGYDNSGGKGITFGLNHVMKVADGEYLGGRSKAEDVFTPFTDEDADSLI
jgi:hypothetical protein